MAFHEAITKVSKDKSLLVRQIRLAPYHFAVESPAAARDETQEAGHENMI